MPGVRGDNAAGHWYGRGMAGRAGDWFRQAEADLEHARHALRDGDHEWACFAARQAAEKAAKAAHEAVRQEAWGHVITELLDALRPHEAAIDDALLDRARALDKLYIPTRYPNGLAEALRRTSTPERKPSARIADAEEILAVCRRVLSWP